MQDWETESKGVIFNEVQLILAEKRTSLAVMRTGIAVFALPLSVLSVLVATSRYYNIAHVMHWLLPLLVLCTGLVLLASYLVIKAIIKMRHYDHLILEIKRNDSAIAEFID